LGKYFSVIVRAKSEFPTQAGIDRTGIFSRKLTTDSVRTVLGDGWKEKADASFRGDSSR
jgi:hypothetical protein